MTPLSTELYMNVNQLLDAVLGGKIGPSPETLAVRGASSIYQTTQFPSAPVKYHNHYLLLRVESYFGACSHTPGQLDREAAAVFSGQPLDAVLRDRSLPVRIAALDAYLGTVFPHDSHCSRTVEIPAGTPMERARARDALIADTADLKPSQRVALIGVVNPLVEAIKQRGARCLPCDLQLKETQWGEAVETDMEKVLDQADSVICTAMTLGNGTFDRILERVRELRIPLTVYAQTGSAAAARFMSSGVTALVAEPFPFTQFSAAATPVYCYTAAREENPDEAEAGY